MAEPRANLAQLLSLSSLGLAVVVALVALAVCGSTALAQDLTTSQNTVVNGGPVPGGMQQDATPTFTVWGAAPALGQSGITLPSGFTFRHGTPNQFEAVDNSVTITNVTQIFLNGGAGDVTTITWQSTIAAGYQIELGGNGTPNSGVVAETGFVPAATPLMSTIPGVFLSPGTNFIRIIVFSGPPSALASTFLIRIDGGPIVPPPSNTGDTIDTGCAAVAGRHPGADATLVLLAMLSLLTLGAARLTWARASRCTTPPL